MKKLVRWAFIRFYKKEIAIVERLSQLQDAPESYRSGIRATLYYLQLKD